MRQKLIIDGNAVYELDEKCMLKKRMNEEKTEEEKAEEKKHSGKHE